MLFYTPSDSSLIIGCHYGSSLGPDLEVELGEGMKVKVIRETISQVVTKSAPPEGSPPPAANEDNKGGSLLGGLFKR